MRLAAILMLVLLGCAHSPAPPPGPRPLGGGGTLIRGDATLAVGLRYEPTGARSLVLLVELAAKGTGSVGPVTVGVMPSGLEVDGPATWTGEVTAGARQELRFPLRLVAAKVARVTVTFGLVGASAVQVHEARFLSEDEQLRACQASEEACREPGEAVPDSPAP